MKITRKELRRLIEASLISEYDVGWGDAMDDEAVEALGEKHRIEYLPGYDLKIIGNIMSPADDSDMLVGICDLEQCAQFVSDTFGKQLYVGNAWHAHKRFATTYSCFKNLSPENLKKVAQIFTRLNKNINADVSTEIKKLALSLVPSAEEIKSQMKLGDIVGLTFNRSENWAKAFFEAASGAGNLGRGKNITGPYFVVAKTVKIGKDTFKAGAPWSAKMLGKDIQFKPGKTLSRGGGFGMNTHVGFVGAMVDGNPIIYHNVHHFVRATGINAMNTGGLMNMPTSVAWFGPSNVVPGS